VGFESPSNTQTTPFPEEGVRAAVQHMAAARPALFMASFRGETEKVRQLLVGGANIEEQGGEAEPRLCTPLHASAVALRVAQVLLQHGADVSVSDNAGITALHQARTVWARGGGAGADRAQGERSGGDQPWMYCGGPCHLSRAPSSRGDAPGSDQGQVRGVRNGASHAAGGGVAGGMA